MAEEGSADNLRVVVVGSTAIARALMVECAKKKYSLVLLHNSDAEEKHVKSCLKACKKASGQPALAFACEGDEEAEISGAVEFINAKLGAVDMILLAVGETFEGEIGEIHASEGMIQPLQKRLLSHNYLALAALIMRLFPMLREQEARIGLIIPPHAFDGSGMGMTAQYALEGYFKSIAARHDGDDKKCTFSIVYNGKHQNARVLLPSGDVDVDAMAGTGSATDQAEVELAVFVLQSVLNREESAVFGDASAIQRSGSLATLQRRSTGGSSSSEARRDSMRASFQLPPACRAGEPGEFSADNAPPLCAHILSGDKVKIKETLKKMKQSNAAEELDDLGRNSLHYACSTGNHEIVMLLLRSKPVPDAKKQDEFLWTPLHYAARAGAAKVVRPLLKNGANPNALTNANKSAVHYFCRHQFEAKSREQQGVESAMKDLFNYGADVNQKDDEHNTPLFDAVQHGTPHTLHFLLTHEGDVHRRNRRGEISLHWAVRDGKLEHCKHLLKFGADPGAVGEDGSCFELAPSTEIMDLLEEYREVNRKDESEDLEKQREPIYIKDMDDFPANVQKIISISGLDKEPELVKEHWVTFLWVLRFLMRKHYCPTEGTHAQH
eukprot:TRINITY_DN8757_c0_g1_i2.p1 TRINITY_DN8757_c0_g1~~TRINITY_DN8757_c0_g1_i2.p1  ORF type:complete len:609 (-),score=165.45 TRINITY_DN8757_c0_g1_i2:144-1970(-)